RPVCQVGAVSARLTRTGPRRPPRGSARAQDPTLRKPSWRAEQRPLDGLPGFWGGWLAALELVPQELIGDFVVELDLGGFDEAAEGAGAALGGGLLDLG